MTRPTTAGRIETFKLGFLVARSVDADKVAVITGAYSRRGRHGYGRLSEILKLSPRTPQQAYPGIQTESR